MSTNERFESGVLSIRFNGEAFRKRGVSIYDLGESLIAIQRIVHKAFLAKNDRLSKGAVPKFEERSSLALQIGARRQQSDAYSLFPILNDPFVHALLLDVTKYVMPALAGYYTKTVLDKIHKEKDANKQNYITNIYPEVLNIVNRVDTSGGIETISLGAPLLDRETFARFDTETKDYMSTLKYEKGLGENQEIEGQVYRLYPTSRIVTIRREGGQKVDIHLSGADFDEIRYHRETRPAFLFRGRPLFRFGVETKSVSEFEAEEIEYMEEDYKNE